MTGDVLGVDFSGASAAGDALWVTEATQTPAGVRIDACYRATDEWGRDRESAHGGLVERVTAEDVRTVGLDFPFSLPQALLDDRCDGTWQGFLGWVAGSEGPSDPDEFSDNCREIADRLTGGRSKNLRRETDCRRAGQCPYSTQIQYQTLYGARNVLGALVDRTDTAVVPMQDDSEAETVVCEVYPAATFGWLGAYREGYKDPDAGARREYNVGIVEDCSVALGEHRRTYLENHDALDSLAAAVSAARVDDGSRSAPAGSREEGCIYV